MVIHALVPWTSILIWTITIFMDRPCSCLWCFCWTSFLIKCFGHDLVMDDYHGQTKLNLNPYQFPLCPCVDHITVTLTSGDFFIGRRFSKWHVSVISEQTSWMLTCGIILVVYKSHCFILQKIATWHILVGSCHFNVPHCCQQIREYLSYPFTFLIFSSLTLVVLCFSSRSFLPSLVLFV